MRSVIIILFALFGPGAAFGQTAEEKVIRLKQQGVPSTLEQQQQGVPSTLEQQQQRVPSTLEQQEGPSSYMDSGVPSHSPPPKTKPLSWDIHLGTGYSHMAGMGSGMFAYTAPMLTVPLSAKWSLHGGVMVSHFMPVGPGFQSTVPDFQSPGAFGMQGSFSSISVFGAASYRMNDRLVLHGAGVKQLATTPLPMTPFSPYQSDRLSLGATYRLGNNVTIGASIQVQQGNGYYTSPFYW